MSSLSEPRRPRLLPQNRKLRHLRGLSLRNLAFAPPTHLRTADDAALNRSPGKLQALREMETGSGRAQKQLLHPSRSSESLSTEASAAAVAAGRSKDTRSRPQRARNASLSLVHASPVVRQKRLESLVDGAVGDVFFSLHVPGEEEPVYVSEVREKSANFNFQFFQLDNAASATSRSCRVTVRIWARRPKHTSWVFLLEDFIDLRRLNFIGTLMDRRFPPNALIFHLEDGLYSLDFPSRQSEPKRGPTTPSSSYNALMRLANLESSIEDAIHTQQKIVAQISELIEETPPDESEAARERARVAEKYIAVQKRANKAGEKRRDELRESLRRRREAIAEGKTIQLQAEEDMEENKEKMASAKEALEKTQQHIRGQRRRICSELSDIFPINPIPNAPPLSFQICNIPLPNSLYDAATAKAINEDTLSAGLGLVTLLTRHLQLYLSKPLPYPLCAYGSRSTARDDISHMPDKQASRREFPLHLPRGGSTTGQWRFEYGWFLLNKDIEALCASQGLKVVDIRHSLPNLKYLLYVCSAGTEDVPERKRGGVRGLWVGRMKGRAADIVSAQQKHLEGIGGGDGASSTGTSRRGSVDSEVMNQHGDALRNAILRGTATGEDDEPATTTARGLNDAVSLPFAEGDAKFTLRTKGLRENR